MLLWIQFEIWQLHCMQTSQTLLVAHCWIVCNAQCTVHSLHSCCKRAKLFPADPRPPSQWLPVKTWKLAPIRDNIRPKMQTGFNPGIPATSDRRFQTGWKLALIPKSWQHLAFWSEGILSHLPVVEIGWTTLWTSVDGTAMEKGVVELTRWKVKVLVSTMTRRGWNVPSMIYDRRNNINNNKYDEE